MSRQMRGHCLYVTRPEGSKRHEETGHWVLSEGPEGQFAPMCIWKSGRLWGNAKDWDTLEPCGPSSLYTLAGHPFDFVRVLEPTIRMRLRDPNRLPFASVHRRPESCGSGSPYRIPMNGLILSWFR